MNSSPGPSQLRKLGNLYVKTKNKLLVVKSIASNPEKIIGADVYSGEMKKIGSIIDVIGNTKNPYCVVKPYFINIFEQLEPGIMLYYYIRKKPVKKTRRGK